MVCLAHLLGGLGGGGLRLRVIRVNIIILDYKKKKIIFLFSKLYFEFLKFEPVLNFLQNHFEELSKFYIFWITSKTLTTISKKKIIMFILLLSNRFMLESNLWYLRVWCDSFFLMCNSLNAQKTTTKDKFCMLLSLGCFLLCSQKLKKKIIVFFI